MKKTALQQLIEDIEKYDQYFLKHGSADCPVKRIHKKATELLETELGESRVEFLKGYDLCKERLIKTIKLLWGIIDDIDTASDIAKGDNQMYRQIVEKLQKRRWETGITTDGYELDLTKINNK